MAATVDANNSLSAFSKWLLQDSYGHMRWTLVSFVQGYFYCRLFWGNSTTQSRKSHWIRVIRCVPTHFSHWYIRMHCVQALDRPLPFCPQLFKQNCSVDQHGVQGRGPEASCCPSLPFAAGHKNQQSRLLAFTVI